jgi:hypothetical protein
MTRVGLAMTRVGLAMTRVGLGRRAPCGGPAVIIDRLLHPRHLVTFRGDRSAPVAERRAGLMQNRPGSTTDQAVPCRRRESGIVTKHL